MFANINDLIRVAEGEFPSTIETLRNEGHLFMQSPVDRCFGVPKAKLVEASVHMVDLLRAANVGRLYSDV